MIYPILAHIPPDNSFCFSQTKIKEAFAPNINLNIQKSEASGAA